MAVMIKNMSMPERCESCPMSSEVDVVQGVAIGCKKEIRIREIWCNTRPDWCPLVEVPKTKAPMTDAELENANFEL